MVIGYHFWAMVVHISCFSMYVFVLNYLTLLYSRFWTNKVDITHKYTTTHFHGLV
jgi:hypothetical protein